MTEKQDEICKTHKEAGVTCVYCEPKQQEETCENCGHGKRWHYEGNHCNVYYASKSYHCSCKRFVVKNSMVEIIRDKKGKLMKLKKFKAKKGCNHSWNDARIDCEFCNPKNQSQQETKKGVVTRNLNTPADTHSPQIKDDTSSLQDLQGGSDASEKQTTAENTEGTSLSDKKVTKEGWFVYPIKDVKNFIKLLKEEFTNPKPPYYREPTTGDALFHPNMVLARIDKLAGDDLI